MRGSRRPNWGPGVYWLSQSWDGKKPEPRGLTLNSTQNPILIYCNIVQHPSLENNLPHPIKSHEKFGFHVEIWLIKHDPLASVEIYTSSMDHSMVSSMRLPFIGESSSMNQRIFKVDSDGSRISPDFTHLRPRKLARSSCNRKVINFYWGSFHIDCYTKRSCFFAISRWPRSPVIACSTVQPSQFATFFGVKSPWPTMDIA